MYWMVLAVYVRMCARLCVREREYMYIYTAQTKPKSKPYVIPGWTGMTHRATGQRQYQSSPSTKGATSYASMSIEGTHQLQIGPHHIVP